jgi:ABC-type transport system involved in multi-copper enzyme maturation permease subunit
MRGDRKIGAAPAIVAIAINTFREAIRDRVLYLLLVFALILIGVSRSLSLLTVGDEEKIIKDVGISAISLFGVLTAVFVGVSLVFKEIERKTVYTLLANPVRRWQFLTGKFAGLLAVLTLNLAAMSLALSAILLYRGESPWSLIPAILLVLIELGIITAFALLFSSLTNPILAAVWTFAIYVMGHLSWSLKLLKEKVPEGMGHLSWSLKLLKEKVPEGLSQLSCDVVYWILPNLSRLDIKSEAVHGLPLPEGFVLLSALYGAAYALVIVMLACLVFERKEFN